jgi:hypothetical protein
LISLRQPVKAAKFETSGGRSSKRRVPLTTSSPPMMTLGVFTSHANLKCFLFHPSHQYIWTHAWSIKCR